ncbi:hypothetical protein BCR34DRAFT_558622 [Clohesyomyces aquaticus]|uniref:Uncharacterized protein n=1 Tax=Clohesyomyces aquaticus TaxID=1231657 RepID=A0A1Y1ZZC9_9PLEO|nr:hypothetical protein BCR34DRAFT_558622 [Clohesyomyces aquaticus]
MVISLSTYPNPASSLNHDAFPRRLHSPHRPPLARRSTMGSPHAPPHHLPHNPNLDPLRRRQHPKSPGLRQIPGSLCRSTKNKELAGRARFPTHELGRSVWRRCDKHILPPRLHRPSPRYLTSLPAPLPLAYISSAPRLRAMFFTHLCPALARVRLSPGVFVRV